MCYIEETNLRSVLRTMRIMQQFCWSFGRVICYRGFTDKNDLNWILMDEWKLSRQMKKPRKQQRQRFGSMILEKAISMSRWELKPCDCPHPSLQMYCFHKHLLDNVATESNSPFPWLESTIFIFAPDLLLRTISDTEFIFTSFWSVR